VIDTETETASGDPANDVTVAKKASGASPGKAKKKGAGKAEKATKPNVAATAAEGPSVAPTMGRIDKLPIKMLNDRLLVRIGGGEGERRSSGGILIPATAQMGKRLTWAEIVAVGPNVRSMEAGDQVLFNPEDRYEVELRGEDFIILRERDIHAVASKRLEEGSTGLYL